MTDSLPSNLVVSVQEGIFVCTDGAGSFTRPATGDEKLLWAEIVRLRTEHEKDLELMERAAQALERLPTPETKADCKDCEQLIDERDRAQDALQDTHSALGGDGEWVGRLPPQSAPDSGDLHLDVPELARERMAEMDVIAEAAARASLAWEADDDTIETVESMEALQQAVRPWRQRRPAEKAGALPAGCHRSHPHENMSAECVRLTEVAQQAAAERCEHGVPRKYCTAVHESNGEVPLNTTGE